MAQSTPHVPLSKATVSSHSSISIPCPEGSDISSKTVWDALTDTSTYPKWNRFVPRVTIREQPDDNGDRDGSNLPPILQLGTRFTFHANMDAPTTTSAKDAASSQKLHATYLVITELDPPDPATKKPGRIVWASDTAAKGGYSAWQLYYERVHEIAEIDDDGRGRTVEVTNWENQTGVLAHAVKRMFGSKIQTSFEVWVEDLKSFVAT